jgi:hypothetical protein
MNMPSLRDFFETKEAQAELYQIMNALPNMSLKDFQKAILQIYRKFKWDSPVIQNGCDSVVAVPGKAVSFTKTQDFIRHYLIPDSPYKGLLAWHSVGTGKTCMAVAAATTQFEQAGYSIMWVTRNSLMADVYKNIFGSICSIPIMEHVNEGKSLPENFASQKRMLSKAWFPPISYRTFQNALQGKNELGRLLLQKNPNDPLKKTFLVMDEIHKLQDGDLGPNESADFEIIQQFIHKSYANSQKDSVRPLLMTATPITDSPKELFDILNTLISTEEKRLMSFQTFRERFTDQAGTISEEGKAYFQDKAKGLISYLNREYDPTTFAQPVFKKINVTIDGTTLPTAKEIRQLCDVPVGNDDVNNVNDPNLTEKERKKRLRDRAMRNKTRRAAIKACYNETKKAQISKSQLQDVEACFGKSNKFPTLKAVMAEKI